VSKVVEPDARINPLKQRFFGEEPGSIFQQLMISRQKRMLEEMHYGKRKKFSRK